MQKIKSKSVPPIRRDLSFLATIIASIATMVAFWQAWISTNTAERQLRAYVIMQPDTDMVVADQDNYVFKATISNVGQTPAYNVISYGGYQFREPIDDDFDKPKNVIVIQSRVTIGNGQKYPLVIHGKDSEYARVLTEKKAVFSYGTIKYADIYNKVRTTVFCWQSFLQNEKKVLIFPCSAHNDAD